MTLNAALFAHQFRHRLGDRASRRPGYSDSYIVIAAIFVTSAKRSIWPLTRMFFA